ncbi:uncharacterized protein MONBRDRAFT_5563 [Monosiga brevicollis MX1]|uniref:Uncharacterized protein n=1 Tax=Monosiga brevicollis TaxID=81824 RepID=A9URT9_MONBE|nr:uncharacterized protein MONBRDRAFT_5563 [Monosiga brevicollis MX1]EDQ91983.1 predicted protein [Monosiga brevicollis MX1]|eukprot:XP_001743269.1 hypothetical protein [Monosiga brevicollis MX1]
MLQPDVSTHRPTPAADEVGAEATEPEEDPVALMFSSTRQRAAAMASLGATAKDEDEEDDDDNLTLQCTLTERPSKSSKADVEALGSGSGSDVLSLWKTAPLDSGRGGPYYDGYGEGDVDDDDDDDAYTVADSMFDTESMWNQRI